MTKVLFLGICLFSTTVLALDFGKHGNVFVIKEEDGRKTFIKSAARADWEKPRAQIKESIKALKANDKNERGLYPPNEDIITFIDPSITAQRDIYAPYVKDGVVKRELIIAKGTTINPLDYMQPTIDRIFINAEDPEQLELINKLVNGYNMYLQVIVVRGSIEEVQKIAKLGVFHGSPSLLEQNQIDFTPSLITVSSHPDYLKKLQVTSLSRPFDIERLSGLISYE